MRGAERELPQVWSGFALGLPVESRVFRDPELNLLEPRSSLGIEMKGDPERAFILVDKGDLAVGRASRGFRRQGTACQSRRRDRQRAEGHSQNLQAPTAATSLRYYV